ncbi:hypothetical protein VUR80DRAFT_9447 [Thermomyces stellatus]
MGRWSYLDTDEERLPEGMTRIAYDADTQTYTFRDATDGSLWKGAPGCAYGKLFRVRPPESVESVSLDKPEVTLKEGLWEPPGDNGRMRKDSLVKKFRKKLGSVRDARSRPTPRADVDNFLHPESELKADDEGQARSTKEKPTSLVQTPIRDEKMEGASLGGEILD